MAYENYECRQCERTFRAHPDANAADSGYCSPRCETVGSGWS
ncbi:hypothetical protein [Halobacterium litoreum]|uniref:Small CPxCG-related zinc finger protein n=1 Tax=Halobacterium litoreum TaxID=2039234 RepID=A0ABD5NAT5_9EURY|nr:hypothetical protein [Halobacterium litoreum]